MYKGKEEPSGEARMWKSDPRKYLFGLSEEAQWLSPVSGAGEDFGFSEQRSLGQARRPLSLVVLHATNWGTQSFATVAGHAMRCLALVCVCVGDVEGQSGQTGLGWSGSKRLKKWYQSPSERNTNNDGWRGPESTQRKEKRGREPWREVHPVL